MADASADSLHAALIALATKLVLGRESASL